MTSNPFLDMDLSKYMDMSKFMESFKGFSTPMAVPGVDLSSMMESQRRNVEALTSANKMAFESAQTLAKRQQEIMRQTMDEMQGVAKDMMATGSTEDKVAQQAEVFQKMLETGLKHMKELSDIVAGSNKEMFDLMHSRMT